MQVTDEMIDAALDAYDAPRYAPCEKRMRAALEAALGACKELPAAEVLERVAKDQLSDPASDDMSVPLAIESVRLAQVVMNRDKCIEDLAGTLRNIAAYDDRPASEHLEKTGSWGQFDEPGGAQIARATLERWGLK